MELKHTIYEQLLPWLWCIDCCKLITGSLMKTATVCRNICISVIVLSVKEMAQSTRHLKWTRYHLRWTFVYLDGHYKNLFGTWTSLTLNHQFSFFFYHHPLVIHELQVFTSSTHTQRTCIHITLHSFRDHDLLPSVFVQIAAHIYQNPRKSKANNIQHGHTNSPPLCRFYTTTLTRLLHSKML